MPLDTPDRLQLLRTNPERYATTGLDWGNAAHHDAIAKGLFQTLMAVLAHQQGRRGDPEVMKLWRQQARVEERLSVVERAICRNGGSRPLGIKDEVIVYGLEKMADAIEEGAAAWLEAKGANGSNVLPGTMLSIAVGMAATVRNNHGIGWFSVGPFGALSQIAGLVTSERVPVEMEDLPALQDLVRKAREVPVGHAMIDENPSCVGFRDAFISLLAKMEDRYWEREAD